MHYFIGFENEKQWLANTYEQKENDRLRYAQFTHTHAKKKKMRNDVLVDAIDRKIRI